VQGSAAGCPVQSLAGLGKNLFDLGQIPLGQQFAASAQLGPQRATPRTIQGPTSGILSHTFLGG